MLSISDYAIQECYILLSECLEYLVVAKRCCKICHGCEQNKLPVFNYQNIGFQISINTDVEVEFQ